MKYTQYKFLIPIVLFCLICNGCNKKDFLNVNNDPNRVTLDNITPELIFPQAAHAAGQISADLNLTFLNQWVGYWSGSGDFALIHVQTTYNIDFVFANNIWGLYYHPLFDLRTTDIKAIANGDSVLAGAAKILSVKLWQELVDMFGDIPYSQAFQPLIYPNPKYDKAKAIYDSLQIKLDEAIVDMKRPARSSFINADVVNHGDRTKWIKFANTLKLRLLIRQSEVSGFDPSAEIAKIQVNGGVLQAGETVSVNPGYSNSGTQQSPFYANYGLTPTGTDANPGNRANVYFINLLKTTNDPRIERFFLGAGGSGNNYVGTVYGLSSGNPTGGASSRIGPGLANSPTQDQWIYPSFESMFLQAEAIARGWMSGDAKTAYENAVRESFVWLGVPDAVNAANTYMADNGIANWDQNAGGTALSKAKFIAYQKYIALGGSDPVESWSDLRRLNMLPDNGYISVDPAKVSNTLPLRLLYPQTEFTTNASSVKAVGDINPFTTKIFWQP